MEVNRNYEVTRFSQIDPGGVMIATITQKQIVHGMKAFRLGKDDDRDEYFVTLGPFTTDFDDPQPTAYDSQMINDDPVLDISEHCCFVPSLNPEDVSFENPDAVEGVGSVFILEDKTYLGIRFCTRSVSWTTKYLDLSSGQIVRTIEHDRCYLTRGWAIEDPDQDNGHPRVGLSLPTFPQSGTDSHGVREPLSERSKGGA